MFTSLGTITLLLTTSLGLPLGPHLEQSGPKPAQRIERHELGLGQASWYGPGFHGRLTANGETYDQEGISAAHRSLPFGTILEVTRVTDGRSIQVRVNDRGPYVGERILDLSKGAARQLGILDVGVAWVKIRVVEPEGSDLESADSPAPRPRS